MELLFTRILCIIRKDSILLIKRNILISGFGLFGNAPLIGEELSCTLVHELIIINSAIFIIYSHIKP